MATLPRLGLGTWRMGEDPTRRAAESAVLSYGIDLGIGLIDTAEMYGEGGAERAVAGAIAGRRAGVFLVSKVYPHHASRREAVAACDRSLRRLGTDHLDLYLLHWRGTTPLAETLEAFAALQSAGKIRAYGVSNFDVGDMEELWALELGRRVVANQILYNLESRWSEWSLRPWCRGHGVEVMAYSPLGQGRLLRHPTVRAIAARRRLTAAQVALAWVLHQDDVVAIAKAARPEHVHENRAALDVHLGRADRDELERAFPPPSRPAAMETT